jgi:hypothetical protein
LHLVPHAPEFTHSVYAVYSERTDSNDLETALRGLRVVAHVEGPLDTENGGSADLATPDPAKPILAGGGLHSTNSEVVATA